MCGQGVQYGAEDATLGDPVFSVRGLEVCLPTLMTWGLAVRNYRIQAHRAVFRPSSISLSGSLRGTRVLKAELSSPINNILTTFLQSLPHRVNKPHSHRAPLPIVKMREGAVYYLEKASSADLFGR